MPSRRKIRYAVAGLGHIAQVAMLPAFKHAGENSELVALISSDTDKLKKLAKKYRVKHTGHYDEFEKVLSDAEADAVYIAVPNSLHAEFAIRAAEIGVHVLCEKPLAVTREDCVRMIEAAERNRVKLMTAYRLHFDPANIKAIELVQSGRIGEPRFYNTTFSMQVREGNIRLDGSLGGGPLFDLGIYCINAARYLFRAEPTEVMAIASNADESRFSEVEEMISAILKFPGERLATLTVSAGAAETGFFEIVGTKGVLRMDPAFDYAAPLKSTLKIGKKESKKTFKKEDQFAPELVYFSESILTDRLIEPSGFEGLCDVRIIEAIFESARTGQKVLLAEQEKFRRPDGSQKMKKPPTREPEVFHAEEPSR
jgi:glucose-fructose oxidoreductase